MIALSFWFARCCINSFFEFCTKNRSVLSIIVAFIKLVQSVFGCKSISESLVMTEDEEHLKHCSLRRPVEQPHQSVVEVHNSGKAEHDHDVTQDVAHGAPWVLDPAMLGYGSVNVDETECRGRPSIEHLLTRGIVFGRDYWSFSLHGHSDTDVEVARWWRRQEGGNAATKGGERERLWDWETESRSRATVD
jgi:hypothetical protein